MLLEIGEEDELYKTKLLFTRQFKVIEGVGYVQTIYSTLMKSERKGQLGIECANSEEVSSLKGVCL